MDKPMMHYAFPRDQIRLVGTMAELPGKVAAVVEDSTDVAIVAAILAAARVEGVTDLYLLDKTFILDALREKLERENPKPLTIEELRQMDGQPVWIDDWWEDSHGWELSMDAADYFDGERRTEKEYGGIWIAYRYKPKEDHHGK